MSMVRNGWIVGGVVAGAAGLSHGQVAYLAAIRGETTVVDLEGNGFAPLARLPYNESYGGMEFSDDGTLWAVSWCFRVYRWSEPDARWIMAFDLHRVNGYDFQGHIKDLAWDPVGRRMLAMMPGHFPTRLDPERSHILELDLNTGRLTAVTDLAPPVLADWPMGIAVDSSGDIWVGRQGSPATLSRVYYSPQGWQVEVAARLPYVHRQVEGLAIDWRRGDTMYLSAGAGLWRLNAAHQPEVQVSDMAHSADIALTPCTADFATDGFVDHFDYFAFIEAFESGDLAADLNHDAHLDFFDYDLMLEAFESGC